MLIYTQARSIQELEAEPSLLRNRIANSLLFREHPFCAWAELGCSEAQRPNVPST